MVAARVCATSASDSAASKNTALLTLPKNGNMPSA